jgi:hypothetical protein
MASRFTPETGEVFDEPPFFGDEPDGGRWHEATHDGPEFVMAAEEGR